MIYFVAIVASIGGFLFGFDTGVIAGALPMLDAQFGIPPLIEGLMSAAVPFGALFGTLYAGRAVSRFGRRKLMLGAALLFVSGALLSALAFDVWVLTLTRLILGFAIGIATLVAPLYISECAPAEKRGMLLSTYQLAITSGILSAYLLGYAVADHWRELFLAAIVPGICLLLGMAVLPDTPRWLAVKGRETEAKAVLARLRRLAPADPEIAAEVEEIVETSESDHGGGGWAELTSAVVRPALVVGMGLFFLQQMSGINAVLYFAPLVFAEAGFSDASTRLLATVGIGTVNALMTVVGMALIDRIGRRKLLLAGFTLAALSMGLVAGSAASNAAELEVIAFVGLMVFIAAFAASIGPLPWVITSEIYPLNIRGLGMSIAIMVNWWFNFLVVFSFPILVSMLGLGGVFAIYAVICAVGVVFTLWYVPETKGVELEDIEEHLLSGRPFRDLGPGAPAERSRSGGPPVSPHGR